MVGIGRNAAIAELMDAEAPFLTLTMYLPSMASSRE
jgi:hypothetical protein